MALIKCPECSHEVSDTAPTCPHCGYQLKRTTTASSYNYSYQSRSHRLYEKEHDRKYKEMIAGGIIALIAGPCFLFFLINPAVSRSGELLGTIIGACIGFVIVGIILLIVGIRRLNE